MNTEKYRITDHPRSFPSKISKASCIALLVLLTTGCAAQPRAGFLQLNQAIPVMQCGEGTVEVCQLNTASLMIKDRQDASCSCVRPQVLQRAYGVTADQMRGQRLKKY
jgi:hypothetical protein